MTVQSIQFSAAAEIARRKQAILQEKGDLPFGDIFRKAVQDSEEETEYFGENVNLRSISRYGDDTESTDLDSIFSEASRTYDVPVGLLKAVAKAESGFNPNAVSSSGAIGVMQLMPATARSLGVTNAYDPKQNIMAGAKYLKQKLDQYDGNIQLALAAYNAGSGNVAKYGGVPPFKETQNYIQKVMGYMEQDTANETVTGGFASQKNADSQDEAAQLALLLAYQQMAGQALHLGQSMDESDSYLL